MAVRITLSPAVSVVLEASMVMVVYFTLDEAVVETIETALEVLDE